MNMIYDSTSLLHCLKLKSKKLFFDEIWKGRKDKLLNINLVFTAEKELNDDSSLSFFQCKFWLKICYFGSIPLLKIKVNFTFHFISYIV